MPTLDNATTIITDGTGGLGTFSSDLTGLMINTTYYLRAYATNSAGTGYGNEITFTNNFYVDDNGVTIKARAGVAVSTTGVVNGVTYTLVDEMTLRMMANIEAIANEELSKVVTTGIDDMSSLFLNKTTFDGDISTWDVSSVMNMFQMFGDANTFNGDIGKWNVSKVTNMQSMFGGAIAFNRNIGGWDVSKVTNMQRMFANAIAFDRDLSRWVVSQVGMEVGASQCFQFSLGTSADWMTAEKPNLTNCTD